MMAPVELDRRIGPSTTTPAIARLLSCPASGAPYSPGNMLSLPIVRSPEERDVPLYAGNIEEDLQRVSRAGLAERVTGGLSWPSKMPCPAWGISATRCRVGAALAQSPGTVCHQCYALGGRYVFPAVQAKLAARYRGLFHPLWTPAMIFLIRWYADRFFRWFDSGDLQGQHHLQNILTICRHTQDVLHWLPTREYETVQACRGEIPENLTVRLSAHRIDGRSPAWWPQTSTVVRAEEHATCPAPTQGGKCAGCRLCWDRETRNVAYRLH
jgi:hypothetical protein